MAERLDIIVALKNEARRGFQQIRGDLRSLSQDAQKASQGIGDFAPGLRKATQQADKLTGETKEQLQLLRQQAQASAAASRADAARSNATRASLQVERERLRLIQQQGRAQQQAARAQARAQRQAANAQRDSALNQIDSLAGNLSGGLAGLGAAAGIAGALQLGQAAFELAETGAQAERLRKSFDNLAKSAGTSGDALISSLRAASRGAISDSNLILAANRANLLGVADTAQELTKLLEVARARGQALGLTTQQAFDDIVTGVGRESRLILDNLGIIVDIEKAQKDYAASIGTTAGALDELQRKEAIVQQILSNSVQLLKDDAKAAGDNAEAFERLAAARRNFAESVGGDLSDLLSGPANIAASVIETLDIIIDKAGLLQAAFGLFTAQTSPATFADTLVTSFVALTDEAGLTGEQIRRVAQEAASADRVLLNTASATDGLSASVGSANAVLSGAVGFFQNAAAAANSYASEVISAHSAIDNLISSTQSSFARTGAGLSDIVGSERAFQITTAQNEAYEAGVEALRQQGVSGDELTFKAEELRLKHLGILNSYKEQDRAAKKLATGGLKAMSKEAGKAQQEFEQLSSKVAGILSGSLNVGVGVDFDKILGREDAVNEPARRLADLAVKGFDSPWVQYFKDKFPGLLGGALDGGGDIKKAAAQALKDFEDGLRPELLDKERAKERVRRMLIGEANIKSLADEISRELAGELGKSTSEVRAATDQALGIVGSQPHSVPIVPDLTGFQEQVQAAFVPPDPSAFQEQLTQTFNLAFSGGDSGEDGQEAAGALRGGIMNSLGGIGIAVAEFIQTEIKSKKSVDIIRESGKSTGEKLVEGFESGIIELPNKFLDKIADLVTSRVDERLTNRQSLVGAQ
jgi:hypothetical protein